MLRMISILAVMVVAGCTFNGSCSGNSGVKGNASGKKPLYPSITQQVKEPGTLVVVCVGDSTVATNEDPNPWRGWGQFLHEHFADNVRVYNLAMNARSSRSFMDEGRWEYALGLRPDYVFVQFAHNDAIPYSSRGTDPQTSYKAFLRRYIDEGAQVGAKVILVTSMERRMFDWGGSIRQGNLEYAKAMREVAQEKGVLLIDLHAYSIEVLEKMGKKGSDEIASQPWDTTHWNDKGARLWLDFILAELRTADGEYEALAGRLIE